MKEYDLLILGSGPAGHSAALRAARLGLNTAIVEKKMDMLGGVCLNEGCIPAKSLYHSAEGLRMSLGHDAGIKDISGLVEKSVDSMNTLKKGLEFVFGKNKIDLILGNGRLTGKNTVLVEGSEAEDITVNAENIIISTGSHPAALNGIDYNDTVLTSSAVIKLTERPDKILIVGGGAIGIEFASYFSVLGSKVMVTEAEENILPREDPDISRRLRSIMSRSDVEFYTNSILDSVEVVGDRARFVLKTGDQGVKDDIVDKVIIATGRIPNTEGIGLKEAGVKTDEIGYIKVDNSMRTNVKNIFAAGDVIPTPMLAHTASAEGAIAAEAAAGKARERIDYSGVPNVVYSHLRVASVGYSEHTLIGKKIDYVTGKYYFKSNGRAVAEDEPEGLIKVLADKKTMRIMGCSIMGKAADEIIHEFVIAVKFGMTAYQLAETIHAHPTFSESVSEACRTCFDKPLLG